MKAGYCYGLILLLCATAQAAVDVGVNSESQTEQRLGQISVNAEFDLNEKLRVGQQRYEERIQSKQALTEMLQARAEARENEFSVVRAIPVQAAAKQSRSDSIQIQILVTIPFILLIGFLEWTRRRNTNPASLRPCEPETGAVAAEISATVEPAPVYRSPTSLG